MPRSPSARARSRHSLRPRLPALSLENLNAEQRALVAAIQSSPRGRISMDGPFGVYLHAPAFGQAAQRLGAHLRYHTAVPPRLSEFAILVTAQHWKAQYEWAVHAPIAAQQGVKPATIRDLQAGRAPKSAPSDEKAIYAFAKELYATRRVSEPTFKRVRKLLGDAGIVELVGILGYYALVAMVLDAFSVPVAEGTPLPFREPPRR